MIDFEHGPLAEDSRFLICGPTGAGKTTILDAICLVLYGTTPRLNIRKVEGYVDEYENFTLGKDRADIKIDDTRMLMRRGSLSAYVELVFTDKDERELKAVWRCNRAHNRPDGNIKAPEWNLFDASDDTLLCSKKPETLKEISRSIGLSFEQFCRTTMLAQGDFTKFLKSDEGEKSQILEKLTGTDIYSEISIRIHQKKTEKEAVRQQIASRMEGVQLLSDEEMTAYHEQQKSLLDEIEKLKQEEKILEDNCQWYSQMELFVKQLDEVRTSYTQQKEKTETATFKAEQQLLKDWNDTLPQRDCWKERKQAELLLSERQHELESLQQTYNRLTSGYQALQLKLREKQQIQQRVQTYLAKEAPNENCYKQITFIESLAKQRKEAMHLIQQGNAAIQLKRNEYAKLQQQLTSQRELVQQQECLVKEKDAEILATSQLIQSLNYEELLKLRSTLEKQGADLRDYRMLVESEQKTIADSQQQAQLRHEAETAVAFYLKEVQQLTSKASQLDGQLRTQQDIYDKQQRACGDLMKEYRSLLSEGDTCPLCGQPIQHLATDEHFVSILKPVKELLDSLRQQAQTANQQVAANQAQLAVRQRDLQQKTVEATAADKASKEAQTKLQAHPLYPTYASSASPFEAVDAQLAQVVTQQQQLDMQLKEVGLQQQKLAELQKTKDKFEKELRNAENIVQDIEKQQTRLKENAMAEQSNLVQAHHIQHDREMQLAEFIDMSRLKEEEDTYLTTLKVGAEHFQVAKEKALSVDTHIQEISTELHHVEASKKEIDQQQPLWAQTQPEQPQLIENLLSQWTSLQTRVGLNTEVRRQAQQQLAAADAALNTYFAQPTSVEEARFALLVEQTPSDMETLRDKHLALRDTMVRLATQKEAAEQNLAAHQQKRPTLDDDTTLATLNASVQRKKDELNEHNQQLGKLTQALETDQKNRQQYAAIGRELEQANEEMNRWSHLHKLFGSNDGKKFRNIAQSYVLEQLLLHANQYLRQFTQRYELECQPGSLTILLRDKEAGGILRPTTTISGGESFLISLSLALGLSSLSRSSFSMDTLFIDEGFGTLDSTYLSSVMDALERLHQIGGKKIGIISHVESLKERLTTQIQVSRVNNTLSKITVVSLI